MRRAKGQRASDERLLAWLRARAAGFTVARIAAAEGVHRVSVNKATNAVMRADLAESGEAPAAVRRAYW